MTSIVLAADEGYLPYVPCTLAQIARFGRAATGVTLVVPEDVDKNLLIPVEGAAVAHGIPMAIAPIEGLDALAAEGIIYESMHISRFTFSKLLFAEILPDLDEVLYFDIDTLIRAPLDDLLAWELSRPLGAVTELDPGGNHLFGTNREPYFNCGVLRMSLERMRKERLWDRSKEILGTHDQFALVDQDVLNTIFRGNIDPLPATFNVSHRDTIRYPELPILHDPTLVHFCGPEKPWHRSSASTYTREWVHYSQQSQRALHSETPVTAGNGTHDSSFSRSRAAGRSRVGSLARAALPNSLKGAIKVAATKALYAAESRIDRAWQWLQPSPPPTTLLEPPDNAGGRHDPAD